MADRRIDASDAPGEFRGTERFELVEQLGAGGMGVVYLAQDRERDQMVALKALSQMSPAAIWRFKREFRALADVSHRNLVSLYDLRCAGPHWFFTMELIRGVDLASHCRNSSADAADQLPTEAAERKRITALDTRGATERIAQEPKPGHRGRGAVAARDLVTDLDTLRHALAQLAEGLVALHSAGHLHCDIKPSNVMVSDGRVVLLDFGLVTAAYVERQSDESIYGTPAYMAPEQVRGALLTPAADWFGFGVVLYELLCGEMPRPTDWMSEYALYGEYPLIAPPSTVRPDVPGELDELCIALLDKAPNRRPRAQEVLRRLGGESPRRERLAPAVRSALVGRAHELDSMRRAVADTQGPVTQVVYVSGHPGMGKTTLVQHFLAPLRRDPNATVLAGRCYQREAVPYKALDSLIDDLSTLLCNLPAQERLDLLPPDAALLARLFPVLSRVPELPEDSGESAPSSEIRRRASLALVALMTGLARRARLVVFIDDVQWGDLDSLPFLDALIRQIAAPVVLILAHRKAEAETSALIRALRLGELGGNRQPRCIDVTALAPAQAETMARTLLHHTGGDPGLAPRLAAESAGDPLFLQALVAFARSHPERAQGGVSLADVLAYKLGQLGSQERLLVELVSVAGQPLPAEMVQRAAGMTAELGDTAVKHLRTEHLLRCRETETALWLEPYHDRIREHVAGGLSREIRAARNRALAEAASRSSHRDPEILAEYYSATGEGEKAARYALVAADNAWRALSFGRAAQLLQRAIDAGSHARDVRRDLLVRLGEAHKAAGAGARAADAFLAAAALGDEESARDLRCQAAGEQMRAGYIREGLATMAPLAERAELRMPAGNLEAIVRGLHLRARLRLRLGAGMRLPEPTLPPGSQGEARARLRLGVCIELASGLLGANPLASTVFSQRALLDACAVGARAEIVRMCHQESVVAASVGDHQRADALLQLAADHSDFTSPVELSNQAATQAILTFLSGRFAEAYQELEHTFQLMERVPPGEELTSIQWVRDMLIVYSCLSLLYRLDVAGMKRVLPACWTRSMQSGNRYVQVMVRIISGAGLHSLANDSDGMERHCREALAQWDVEGVQLPHFMATLGLVWADFARSTPRRALERMRACNGPFRRASLFHIVAVRVTWYYFHGVALTATAWQERRQHTGRLREAAGSRALLYRARRDWRRLSREKAPWASPLAALLRANIEHVEGRRDRARRSLGAAASGFERQDMPVWRDMCRWLQGRLIGGAAGERLCADREKALRASGIVHIENGIRTVSPTFLV